MTSVACVLNQKYGKLLLTAAMNVSKELADFAEQVDFFFYHRGIRRKMVAECNSHYGMKKVQKAFQGSTAKHLVTDPNFQPKP
jgi:hypothetical protein